MSDERNTGVRHPKAGDVVGDRTVIRVWKKALVFGQREGDLPNCGAYLTDFEEWFSYKAGLMP